MDPPPFTRKEVDHLAMLAALSLDDREADAMTRELAKIVAYVQELSGVQTDVDAGASASEAAAAWREDVVSASLGRDELLRAAPRTAGEGFAVPGFVPGGGGADTVRERG